MRAANLLTRIGDRPHQNPLILFGHGGQHLADHGGRLGRTRADDAGQWPVTSDGRGRSGRGKATRSSRHDAWSLPRIPVRMRLQPRAGLPSRCNIFVVRTWPGRAKLRVFGRTDAPAAPPGASASLHELNPELSVRAPHHATAPPEPKGKLLRHLLRPDRELGAAQGDVAYDAAQRRRTVAGIDLRQVLQVVADGPAAFVGFS